MAAKILNLDKLSADGPARQLKLGGKTYDIAEMSVDNFIQTTREAEKLMKDKAGMADQVEATIVMIQRSVPGLEAEVLRKHSLETLGKIGQFVRGEIDDQAEQAEGVVAPGNATQA